MCRRDVEVNEGGRERVRTSAPKGERKAVGGGRGWAASDRPAADQRAGGVHPSSTTFSAHTASLQVGFGVGLGAHNNGGRLDPGRRPKRCSTSGPACPETTRAPVATTRPDC